MSSGLIQALNTTSSSQREITSRATYHAPFNFSTNPEANMKGDVAATLDMNTACGAKYGQIDWQSLHTVAGTPSHDKENDGRYVVVWDGTGLSLIRRG
jgi:hypothetical protein